MAQELGAKPNREELEAVELQLKKTLDLNECSAEQAELKYGKV